MARPKKPVEPEEFSSGAAAWGVEITFFGDLRPPAFHGVRKISLDHKHITLDLESGESIAYEFADVQRVLSVHSSKYQDRDSESTSEG